MKDNFEELDQRFLEITRDLTNSLGHELLTDVYSKSYISGERWFNGCKVFYPLMDT